MRLWVHTQKLTILVFFFYLIELAFQILKGDKDLSSRFDEKGISPLHLLAEKPTAFRSGTRLSLIDKIIYHRKFTFTSFPAKIQSNQLSNHNIIPNSSFSIFYKLYWSFHCFLEMPRNQMIQQRGKHW